MEQEEYYWSYFFPMRKGILDDDYYFLRMVASFTHMIRLSQN